MTDDKEQLVSREPLKGVRNRIEYLKYLLLVLLLMLLAAEIASGEFREIVSAVAVRRWLVWLILIIKLLLIFLLLVLIYWQRKETLFCKITQPNGCAKMEYDPNGDRSIIRVKGSAGGTAFGSYTLEVHRSGASFPIPVIYPGGGSSGSAPVINGELGQLDFSGKEPEAGFEVILTVSPAGTGSPKICKSNFEILYKIAYIEKIGEVPARVEGPHPDDPTEALKKLKIDPDPAPPEKPGPETSVGGSISVVGGADYYGCGRQMSEYVLQHRKVDFSKNPWQQDAGQTNDWNNINDPLPFGDANHPRTHSSTLYFTFTNYVRNGKLTRHWIEELFTLWDSFFGKIEKHRWVTKEKRWNTSDLNGYFTVRLRVKHQPIVGPLDPNPPELYDAVTVWLDNRPIKGKITGLAIAGGETLGACDELLLSQFVTSNGTKVKMDIEGRAWDPLILNSYKSKGNPNDNFDYYTLKFWKDGISIPGQITPVEQTKRVPDALAEELPPPPGDRGTLYSWDIVGALDAGPMPKVSSGSPPDPGVQLFRGQRCAYIIELYVCDTTRLDDTGTPHYRYNQWPFCIENDLPDDLQFPVPEPTP
jgi:hypothetical protein